MYAPYFGLKQEPFSIAPDPRFLFMSEQHREALAHLLYGLGGGGGFVLLTGEIGAGKTTVCRCFLEQVPPTCSVAYIFNPKLTATELLQTVCAEFGLPLPQALADGSVSIKALVDALNAFLLQAHAQGRQAVLVIDEAQSLSADVLEQLRLLTNLETAERKLLQIVLIGQPELREMLARPGLEQLAQRVVARYHLGPLTAAQTQQYIRHRLAVAGTAAQLPFDAPALARIHALSGGVPRRINLLADRALLGAYAQGRSQVDRRTVQQAAVEVFGPAETRSLAPRVALVLGLTLLAGAGLGWALHATRPSRPSEPALTATAVPNASVARAVETGSPAVPLQAAAVAASGASATSSPAVLTDAAPVLAAAQPVQATAWRELALRWNVAIGEGEPCVVAAQAQLGCFRSPSGGLALARQLGRPGLLTLRTAADAPVHVLLLAVHDSHATLQAGAQRFELALPALAAVWRGDYATFWRLPPGWRGDGSTPDLALLQPWVDARLQAAGVVAGAPQTERVRAYQLAQGLPADGRIGPLTLMSLSRLLRLPRPAADGPSAAAPALEEPRLGGAR